jgi:ABC-type Na+ transport system ATPase subunit NatA
VVRSGATPPATQAGETAREVDRILFPEGGPGLADSLQERYDPMDLRHAVGVLMGNRDLVRRLATEAGLVIDTGVAVTG